MPKPKKVAITTIATSAGAAATAAETANAESVLDSQPSNLEQEQQPIVLVENENKEAPPKSKRGRKPKVVQATIVSTTFADDVLPHDSTDNVSAANFDFDNAENIEILDETKSLTVSSPKKRGRKPKGGKIVPQVLPAFNAKETKTNVILHLKCSLKDLLPSAKEDDLESFNFVKSSLTYDLLKPDSAAFNKFDNEDDDDEDEYEMDKNMMEAHNQNVMQHGQNMKEIMKKLKVLEHDMHLNNVSNKKSHCFWDTCEFEGTPIYIPKFFLKGSYHVYGCFCSPNCAAAYLMKEKLDSSTKFERYHLLHLIYGKAFNYSTTFKPAADPYHTLDKYFGNLTIQEFRALFHADRLFLIVDKPLTRIMPELHEDNDDFIINNKIIPSNTFKIKKKTSKTTKTNIVNEKFGLANA